MLLKRSRLFIILTCTMILIAASAVAVSASSRGTDVTSPGQGNTLVLVSGSFERADVQKVLNLVNSYRLEACRNGYPDPDDRSRKLTINDYSPVKWSGDLEWIAQTRAAEGAVCWAHERPNGTSCFTCMHNGVSSNKECLAWNSKGLIRGIEQWYAEKELWLEGESVRATGHYTAMIDTDVKYIGMGCFQPSNGSKSCTAAEFSIDDGLSGASYAVSGKYDQWIEVQSSCLSGLSVSGRTKVVVGQNAWYSLSQSVTYPGGMDDSNRISTPVVVQSSGWTVSKSSVASIGSNGVLHGKKTGKVTVTGRSASGRTASKTISIVKPYKGAVLNISGSNYKITKLNKEVSFVGSTSGAARITVPATVKYLRKRYKVTAIGASALSGNRTVNSLVIGKNIRSIGKNAFKNCSALTNIKISTKNLSASKVGAYAFKGTPVRNVKCPKSKKKAYRKIFVKKGISKAAKFY